MKVGFALPQFGGQARDAAAIPAFARELEEAGAHSLWVGDRLLAAVDPTVGYGGAAEIPAVFDALIDPFIALALAAASTQRVRLGGNVLNAPFYPPAVLARQLTSIDVASAGRLTAGFGIGWSPEEYEAVGVPFTHRGARLDETLDALEAIWTEQQPEFRGRYVTVPKFRSGLRPVQQPHPPVYLGAFADAALERVVRRGAGWLPVLAVGVRGPEAIVTVQERLYRTAEQAGRDPGSIPRILRVNVPAGTAPALILAAVRDGAARTGIDELFIDLMHVHDSAAAALDGALHLVRELQKG
ncbi:MAG TPA: TIGR03619 family F420-dependent LLM class oxidoreductase [Actinocrinis sp.]|nr:TIGR03619 family F420-dependent LLM class oxidoreductase [Actinocrinis sp.]